jgi:hypothetical protein
MTSTLTSRSRNVTWEPRPDVRCRAKSMQHRYVHQCSVPVLNRWTDCLKPNCGIYKHTTIYSRFDLQSTPPPFCGYGDSQSSTQSWERTFTDTSFSLVLSLSLSLQKVQQTSVVRPNGKTWFDRELTRASSWGLRREANLSILTRKSILIRILSWQLAIWLTAAGNQATWSPRHVRPPIYSDFVWSNPSSFRLLSK